MSEAEMRSWGVDRSKILWMSVIVLAIIAFDQFTKQWAAAELMGRETLYYLWGTVQLRYAENTGAWGGLGSGLSETARVWALVAIPSLFLIGLAVYVAFRNEFSLAESLAFAAILGGGVGNLIDRIIYGYVVDFLYMGYGKVGTNIFNIADVAIMAGTILVIYYSFRSARHSKTASNLEIK